MEESLVNQATAGQKSTPDREISKEVYIQTQHWARHNENLIVAANGLILSGVVALIAAAIKNFQEKNIPFLFWYWILLTTIPAMGLMLTKLFHGRYKQSIERLIVYERHLGCHEVINVENGKEFWTSGGWVDAITLVPSYLHKYETPQSVKAFYVLHGITLLVSFLCLCYVFPLWLVTNK